MRTWQKLGLLSTLYLSQGLPYGFFVQAVPTLLRKSGSSLTMVSLSTVLMLPWALKLFLAPFVDKHRGSPLGARRGFIVPLQGATALCCVVLSAFGGVDETVLVALAAATVVTAAFAATQDCATDGLAVDLLDDKERGHGNGVQVAAYRIGMIVGGAALLVVYDAFGWRLTFLAMGLLLAAASLPILLWREPRSPSTAQQRGAVALLVQYFTRPRVWPWLALLVVYKIGDAYGSPMVRPLLVDRGMSLTDIGVLVGGFGSGAALVGALAGGWLASSAGRSVALLSAGLVHAALMAGYALPAWGLGGDELLLFFVVVEHFTGSAATVALFTVMMDTADPSSGATDYTAQASVIVWATFLGAAPSGVVADHVGYAPHFLIAGLVCAIGAVALVAGIKAGAQPERTA